MAKPVAVRDAFLDDFRSADDVLQSFKTLPPSQDEEFDDAVIDACLIAAGQDSEQCEMGAYSRFLAWAAAMGHNEELDLPS